MGSSDESYAWSCASDASADSASEEELKAMVKRERGVKQEADEGEHYLQRRVKRERAAAASPSASHGARTSLSASDTNSTSDKVTNKHKAIKGSPNKSIPSKKCVSDSSSRRDDFKQRNGSVGDSSPVNGYSDREISELEENRNSVSSPKTRQSKISDRIQFEDELEENLSEEKEVVETGALQRYVRTRGAQRLQPTAFVPHADEELWLLRLPSNVTAKALLDTTLTLDARCKAKLQGQHYEGRLQPPLTLTLLTHSRETTLRNYTVQGSVRFRQKVPKPHALEDTAHPVAEAIPLPATKCRHPLLGTHYKKVIKSVRKQLKVTKARTVKTVMAENVMDSVPAGQADPPTQKHNKKRKKSRASESDDDIAVSSKRTKRHHRSTNQWDSVQDIEQNLFNF